MATFAIDHAEQIELQASERKAEAEKHFKAIVKSGKLVSTSSMTIGWNAFRLKKKGLFGILGFASEHEVREAAGVSESTWYAQIKLAESFEDLTEEQYVSMKDANAKALADLPASKRYDSVWIRQAGTDKIKDFEAKVDAEMEGKARASDGKETGVVLKMPMPNSRKKVIEQGLKDFARSTGINEDDTSKALEVMVMQNTGQMSLVEAIANAVQRVKEAKEIRKSERSETEQLEAIDGLLDSMVLDFNSALNSIENQAKEA